MNEILRTRIARRKKSEQVLQGEIAGRQDAESRCRDLVEDLDVIVWEADAARFQFNSVAGRAEEILGYDLKQWTEEPDFWANHIYSEDRARAVSTSRVAAEKGQDHQLEYRAVAADGRIVWLRDMVRVIRQTKAPQQLRGVMLDITERKRAEALLAGEKRVLEMMTGGKPLSHVLDHLALLVEEQVPGLLCSILLLDIDGVHLRHGAAPSLPEAYSELIDGESIGPCAGSCGTAAYNRTAVIVSDIASDPLWAQYRDLALSHGLRACWSTPIFSTQSEVLGTLAMYYREPRSPTHEDFRLIERATHLGAIAIERKRAEEALRESERRYRLLFERNQAGVSLATLDGRLLDCNQALARMFGYESPAEMRAQEVRDFYFDPADREFHASRLREKGFLSAIELRCRKKDGTPVWVLFSASLLPPEGNEPNLLQVTAVDITERKRAEEEVNRREAQLAEAQRIAQLGSYEWDVHTNTVRRSEELHRIFGLHPDEFKPSFEGYLERVHPDDRDTTRKRIELAFGERRPFEFEERIVRPDGAVRLLRSQGKWTFDQTQAPVRLVGICQDITELRRSEEALRRNEAELQTIFDNAAIGIALVGLSGRPIRSNPALQEILGYSETELSTLTFVEVTHPDDAAAYSLLYGEVIDGKRHQFQMKKRYIRKDGEIRWARLTVSALREGSEQLQSCLVMVEDITQQELAEASLRQLAGRLITAQEEERSRIARELHDDFNQRLGLLAIGLGQLRYLLPESEHGLRAGIDKACQETNDISEDVHRLSHNLHSSILDNLGLVPALRNLCLEFSQQYGVKIEFRHSDRPSRIPSDVALPVFRIAQECLRNVARHSRARVARVWLEGDDRTIRLIVEDNGVGFDAEARQNKPGLGLISMRERLRLVNGKISIQSSPSRGTRVEATVPLREPAAAVPREEERSESAAM